MSQYMRIIDVRGRGLTEQELTTVRVIGSDEVYVTYRTKPPRYLEIDYEIRAKNKEELRKKIDEVSAIIETTEKVPIIFPDELNRTYFGEYAGVEESVEYHHVGIHRGTIYILRDPYKYGPEKTVETTSDTFNIENDGTAETEPIIELTATQKATFAMVSLGDEEYNLIGRPTDVDEEVVDTRTLLFSEDGSTLDTWTSAGTSVDGGVVTGAFGTDGAGITIPDYGTGSAWHGPALIKEVQPVQDFEVVAHLQMRTTEPNQTSRIEVYLFDENMNVLGKMAVVDNARNRHVKKGEARIGPYVGRDVNYLISSQNYQYNWDYFFGMLRIRRVGKEFEFYITRIHTNTQHVFSLKETYIDNSNYYAGKLKYIQIHAATYGDTPKSYSTKFFTVSAYELAQTLIDETPYIIYPGDIIEFDHVTKDIRINGESRKDLKAFGGSFFTLKKGINTLTITPENTFNTKITYRERYK